MNLWHGTSSLGRSKVKKLISVFLNCKLHSDLDFVFHFIGQITQHKWAWPFMHPVDVEGLGLHDYYEVNVLLLLIPDIYLLQSCTFVVKGCAYNFSLEFVCGRLYRGRSMSSVYNSEFRRIFSRRN